MKKIIPILVILLCLGALALPAAAANDKGSKGDENSGPADGTLGQPQVTRGTGGPAEQIPAGQGREESRVEKQSESPGGEETRNRTEARLENQAGDSTGKQGSGSYGTSHGQNVSAVREAIRLERQQMNATLQEKYPPGLLKNASQNQVRLAVHTLLAMENRSGGIGPQVSAIARDFNNSAQSAWKLEAQIQDRDAISRLFFGGDAVAAAGISNLTQKNQNRIRQIQQIMNSGDLDPEIRVMLEEQLQAMEQEDLRLENVSAKEQKDKGLFGWIGK